MLLTYKQDKLKLNPFEEPDPGKPVHMCAWSQTKQPIDDTLDKLKSKLAQEDLEQQRARVAFLHNISPVAFL